MDENQLDKLNNDITTLKELLARTSDLSLELCNGSTECGDPNWRLLAGLSHLTNAVHISTTLLSTILMIMNDKAACIRDDISEIKNKQLGT